MADEKRPEQPRRKPYRRPEIRSSELFERRSLSCGIQPSARGQPGCGSFQQSV